MRRDRFSGARLIGPENELVVDAGLIYVYDDVLCEFCGLSALSGEISLPSYAMSVVWKGRSLLYVLLNK